MKPIGGGAGDELRADAEVQVGARNLFAGCVPERDEEIAALWAEYDLMFRLAQDTHDGENLVMRGGLYRYIDFNHRTLRAVWVAGYAAWEGYSAMAAAMASNEAGDFARFQELVGAVGRIANSAHPECEPLPEGIAEPGRYDGQSVPRRVAADLATFAACWAFLHEVRHVQHQREGTGADRDDCDPSRRHQEELSCDSFATEYLLAKAGEYAAAQAVPLTKVRLKRETGIYFALFALGVLSEGRIGDTPTHPALSKRIDAVQAAVGSQGTWEAQVIARLAFEALRRLYPEMPTVPITLCA